MMMMMIIMMIMMMILQSAGCYDPVRRVVTLQDGCFADYHCNDLPNTQCAEVMTMMRMMTIMMMFRTSWCRSITSPVREGTRSQP